ncbi:MAG: peptidylprolyl isomerase A [Marinicaulis sp.]|nr:peptidylprolyl isomerase A [Marinicaulis sp.]NNL88767.1 peptidylprolyl isomerase A [Marinicaulis sp.]
MNIILKTLLAALVSTAVFSSAFAADKVKIETSMGDITVELDREKAPVTVANFLEYANGGHYDRTIIHRVVHGYVFQGGGYSKYFNERPLQEPISYEGDNGLKNLRGAIAMARGDSRDSAQSQWFINVKDNPELDHRIFEGAPLYGYAVFGRVVDGMDVVDAIGAVETGPGGDFASEVPVEPIIVNRVDLAD